MNALHPTSLLLDTCVWLDNYLGSRPASKDAQAVVLKALELDVQLLYAAASVKDVHYIIAQTLKRERRAEGMQLDEASAIADNQTAWACTANMRDIATAVGMDASDVWLAEKYRCLHSDVEDNLMLAAATRAHADILVTDDLSLIHHAPVAAMTPADTLKLLNAM